ncbi:hypothetical protein FD755_009905 [Muntiacus reevesi]|uniref:DLG associated protein 1 n=1 Tax=Muntiacus reevesi TaxID=9886 RepID=A0A5N3XYA6_MUNRE|nr:hypothetical protein FD755_009905 [Muntiacus reevesi]
MKGLSGSRSHHHGVTCDSACDSLSHHADRKPYLLSPVEHHPADHPYYTQRTSFQAECVGPFSDPLASSTFPRRHYTSQQELKDECALVPRTLATKANRIPANLLDQFERQLPLSRDGYHTLQYKRTAVEHRSDSPGRIRHLVHSVQKLFTKSHSLEGPSKGSVNGGKASPDETQTVRYGKRSKSKERRPEPKPRNNTSPGWWSSDDNLDGDMCIYHSPSGVMTMGRCPDRSASQYFMEAYNTISEQAVKASRSNNDVKCSTCANLPVTLDAPLLKKSAWSSTLTVSRAREVYQKASVNMDQAMVKSESCQQERSCQYLQIFQAGSHWVGTVPDPSPDFRRGHLFMSDSLRPHGLISCIAGRFSEPPGKPQLPTNSETGCTYPKNLCKISINITIYSSFMDDKTEGQKMKFCLQELMVTVCIRIWSRDMDLKTLKLFNSQLRCGWLLYIWNRAFMAHLRVSANHRKSLKVVKLYYSWLSHPSESSLLMEGLALVSRVKDNNWPGSLRDIKGSRLISWSLLLIVKSKPMERRSSSQIGNALWSITYRRSYR